MQTRELSNANEPVVQSKPCRCGVVRATCWRCTGTTTDTPRAPGDTDAPQAPVAEHAQPRPGLEEEGAHRPRAGIVGAGKGYESPAPGLPESLPGGPHPSWGAATVGAPGSGEADTRAEQPGEGAL